MSKKELVDLQFSSPYPKFEIFIPNLKSKGGSSINLPLRDYANGGILDKDKQVLKGISINEANDLIRVWPNYFSILQKKRKESEPQ
jgi:hypothetical protein